MIAIAIFFRCQYVSEALSENIRYHVSLSHRQPSYTVVTVISMAQWRNTRWCQKLSKDDYVFSCPQLHQMLTDFCSFLGITRQ